MSADSGKRAVEHWIVREKGHVLGNCPSRPAPPAPPAAPEEEEAGADYYVPRRDIANTTDAEKMLRARWIGDLSAIPLGKVTEFMAEFATDYAADRLARAESELEKVKKALEIPLDDVGRIMHESWSKTKRAQGWHGPNDQHYPGCNDHPDLIPWEDLPEPQKDINRHAFDAVLAEIKRRAALSEKGSK